MTLVKLYATLCLHFLIYEVGDNISTYLIEFQYKLNVLTCAKCLELDLAENTPSATVAYYYYDY